MNRRSFLEPSRLASVASPFLSDEPAFASGPVPLMRASRRAMATTFEILLPPALPQVYAAASDALDVVDAIEDMLTVYRDDSDVSRLNATAASGDAVVDGILFALLERCAVLARETQGAFDIACGALVKAWGFYSRSGRVPSVRERTTAMNATGMRYVVLKPDSRSVRYLRSGLEVNFGGIGKGYALDEAGKVLECYDIGDWLIHGGSSSVLARGDLAGRPWTVDLKHPWLANVKLGSLRLKDNALGTSAATYQHFEYEGRKLGHLLDPRRGWPAEGVAQVSVLAPTAALADALSTAFYVMGVEAAREYCRTHPDIGAVILPMGSGPDISDVNTVSMPIVLGTASTAYTPPDPAPRTAGDSPDHPAEPYSDTQEL